jgi:hypothetical protein
VFGCQTGGRKVVVKAFSWSTLWFIGWLFTIGFAHLSFWKGVLALIVWPYFLGSSLG